MEFITKDDLELFRASLLKDIRSLICDKQTEEYDESLKSKEVKQILKISASTLQNLRISGEIKFRKVGGSYYYSKKDIEKRLGLRIR